MGDFDKLKLFVSEKQLDIFGTNAIVKKPTHYSIFI
jgi:hypothetical protein